MKYQIHKNPLRIEIHSTSASLILGAAVLICSGCQRPSLTGSNDVSTRVVPTPPVSASAIAPPLASDSIQQDVLTAHAQATASANIEVEKRQEIIRTNNYISDLGVVKKEIQRAQDQFNRVMNNPEESIHFQSMLVDILTNYNKALRQMDALIAPIRFQKPHSVLRDAIQRMKDNVTSTLQAARNQNNEEMRLGLFGIGNSYQAIGKAQMAMGAEMQAFEREQATDSSISP